MAGKLYDLSDSDVRLPEFFLVDTNLVFERVIAGLSGRLPVAGMAEAQRAYLLQSAARSKSFFERLQVEDVVAIVGPTVNSEFLHLAIRAYLDQYGSTLTPPRNARALYKQSSQPLAAIRENLRHMHALLKQLGLVFLTPGDLGTIAPGTIQDDYLIDPCCRYSLDTADASMLFEAERLGIEAIATMDPDFRRALPGFDVYTWL